VVGPAEHALVHDREIGSELLALRPLGFARTLDLLGGAHSDASRWISTPPPSDASARVRRSKTKPDGIECKTTPEIITGRRPRRRYASVCMFEPSTTVTAPRP